MPVAISGGFHQRSETSLWFLAEQAQCLLAARHKKLEEGAPVT
jgi:hypothetical protein